MPQRSSGARCLPGANPLADADKLLTTFPFDRRLIAAGQIRLLAVSAARARAGGARFRGAGARPLAAASHA